MPILTEHQKYLKIANRTFYIGLPVYKVRTVMTQKKLQFF